MLEKVLSSPLRWTGSKKKLLNEMIVMFDQNKKIYIEPFLGSGVVLLNVLNFGMFDDYFVNDVNENLISFYSNLKDNPQILCKKMEKIAKEFNNLESDELKEEYFYNKRKQFNGNRINFNTRSAVFWFLMKTGFNGVYRVNANKEFNVPFGKKYVINFDKLYFINLSKQIQNVHFYCKDYEEFFRCIDDIIDKKACFIYCDPPYIPETSSTKNQILYTADRFQHEKFLDFLKLHYLKESSVMVSMSKSISANQLYNRYFRFCFKVNDIIRIVNPKKRLKSIEEGYLNYKPQVINKK